MTHQSQNTLKHFRKSAKKTEDSAPRGIPVEKHHPIKKTPLLKDGLDWAARLGLGILLFAFALAIYQPSFQAPFHFDDVTSVVTNQYVQIRDLKPAPLFRAAFQDFSQNRPFSNLSLALNYYVGQLNPVGYHIVNFLFFCLTALGIWLLLERLFLHMGFGPVRSLLAAWLSALLWAAHPLNIQAVTYIVQRHTSFAGAFSIWSIYFFHTALETKKEGLKNRVLLVLRSLGVVGCGLSALLCKETALTLPALIFLYKVYFFDELKPGWLRQNFKWVIALAVFYALGATVALRPAMLARMGQDFTSNHLSAWGKFLSAPRPLFWYLGLVLFPFPQFLNLLHEFPESTGLFHPWTTAFSWAAFLAVVFIALARARSHRLLSFAVLWYLGSLAVESMPLPIYMVFEHRLYLALLSLLVPACAWPVLRAKSLKPVFSWALAVALFFGFFTFSRNRVWTSDAALWKDVVQKSPNSSDAYNNHGIACAKNGQLDLAISDFSKALALDPKLPNAYFARGAAYADKGQPGPAIMDFSKNIELNPKNADAYLNRGIAYVHSGQIDRAIADFNKTIELNPKYPEAYDNRGVAFRASGRLDLAISDYDKAIELDPKDAKAYGNRGNAYGSQGQFDRAISDFSKALEMDPKAAQVYHNRGISYAHKGQLELAIADFSKALELNPKDAEVYAYRGTAYKAKGQDELARKDFAKAIELDPNLAQQLK